MSRSRAVLASLAGGLALWALLGGSPNSDTLWALSWGRQLDGGRVPALAAPGAPTPHPLTTALAALLAPLGPGVAGGMAVAGCLVALAALALVVFALGRAWFGPAAGALAALLVLTRPELLSFGARAYMDVPYLVLVLGGLRLETRRRRAGSSGCWRWRGCCGPRRGCSRPCTWCGWDAAVEPAKPTAGPRGAWPRWRSRRP